MKRTRTESVAKAQIRQPMSVPVAVYLRETYPEAYLAFCAEFGVDFVVSTVLAMIESAPEQDRIMRERPRPGRGGLQ